MPKEQKSYWRPEVVAFADMMEHELRKNDHKEGWKNDTPDELLPRLLEELEEVFNDLRPVRVDTIKGINWVQHHLSLAKDLMTDTSGLIRARPQIGKELADVANFCMFLADVFGVLKGRKT